MGNGQNLQNIFSCLRQSGKTCLASKLTPLASVDTVIPDGIWCSLSQASAVWRFSSSSVRSELSPYSASGALTSWECCAVWHRERRNTHGRADHSKIEPWMQGLHPGGFPSGYTGTVPAHTYLYLCAFCPGGHIVRCGDCQKRSWAHIVTGT